MIKFNEVTWYSKLAAIIFFIGVLPILTFYIGTVYQSTKVVYPEIETSKGLSDEQFIEVVSETDDKAKVRARGDINGDGYEDAIVQEVHCGASCSISLQVVLNEENKVARLLKDKNYPDTFSPAYWASSAAKSQVTDISIKDGIISLTGKGLACIPSNIDTEEPCTEEKWSVVKTVTYKFDGTNIVQLDVQIKDLI